MKYQAIIVAAGNSTRANLSYNKMLYKIDDIPMVYKSAINFIDDPDCSLIVLAINKDNHEQIKQIFKDVNKVKFVIGGKTRQESVKNALSLIDEDYVLIHDGARPFYSKQLLNKIKEKLLTYDVVIPVIDVKDSIFQIKDNKVEKLLKRDDLKAIQTPQGFKTSLIKKAHEIAKNNNYSDDSSMVKDLLNKDIYVIDGEIENKKYTYNEDFKK